MEICGPVGIVYSDTRKLHGAIWSLIISGFIIPRLKNEGDIAVFLHLTLSESGQRLASQGEEHPSYPGFARRFRAKAPTATDAIVAHLEDAVACLDAGVLRPALMMMGLMKASRRGFPGPTVHAFPFPSRASSTRTRTSSTVHNSSKHWPSGSPPCSICSRPPKFSKSCALCGPIAPKCVPPAFWRPRRVATAPSMASRFPPLSSPNEGPEAAS